MVEKIDGKAIALNVVNEVKEKINSHLSNNGRAPFLAVILVGDDPASKIYVGHKERACTRCGIQTKTYALPAETSQNDVLKLIDKLNKDSEVDSILVQLPLPKHIEPFKVVSSILPIKDVDGLGPINQGLLALNSECMIPCTPIGILTLLKSTGEPIEGKHAVVVGRSQLVGSPLVRLLGHNNATVTNIHSRSLEPQRIARTADILVVATGVRHLVDKSWVKKGATLIDVGMHKKEDGKLTGDIDFDSIKSVAKYCTPVPYGVGPMTIASLVSNCLQAYEWRIGKHNPYNLL